METLWVDTVRGAAGRGSEILPLSPREVAVLAVFAAAGDRVVPRTELARRAGLRDLTPRRCDALLVGLRRTLGDDAISNVRGRGWRCLVAPIALPPTG